MNGRKRWMLVPLLVAALLWGGAQGMAAQRRASTATPRTTLQMQLARVTNAQRRAAAAKLAAARKSSKSPLSAAISALTKDVSDKGAEVSFDQVLMVEKDGGEVMAGAPFLAGTRVVAVVDGAARGPKIRVFKKKRRKGMRRTKGHRSTYTRLTVKEIVL